MDKIIEEIDFAKDGLVPAIIQDVYTGEVLMLAYMNKESMAKTLETGYTWFWSRSRQELWRKGATSGNTQAVAGVRLDCDGDALLYLVRQSGPACHTGARSCFFTELKPGGADYGSRLQQAVQLLDRVVASRLRELPEGSYVTDLHERGIGYVAQKVVEEAGETIVAALQGRQDELHEEAADLLFHLTVLLHEQGGSLDGPAQVLLDRHRGSDPD